MNAGREPHDTEMTDLSPAVIARAIDVIARFSSPIATLLRSPCSRARATTSS